MFMTVGEEKQYSCLAQLAELTVQADNSWLSVCVCLLTRVALTQIITTAKACIHW